MKISVITVNYNNKEGLKFTINSVLQQKFNDYEFIIVDGDSDDGSKELLNTVDSRITCVSEQDSGIYEAMNKGVRLAKGEYCIFMNSGDIFKDENVLCNVASELKYDIIVGIGQWGDTNRMIYPPVEKVLSISFFIKSALHHQSSFIKRDLLIECPYDESYKIAGDAIFFFKSLILNNCSYRNIDIVISKAEPAGVSCNLDRSLKERYQGIRNCLPPRVSSDMDVLMYYCVPFGKAIYYWGRFFKKTVRILKRTINNYRIV